MGLFKVRKGAGSIDAMGTVDGRSPNPIRLHAPPTEAPAAASLPTWPTRPKGLPRAARGPRVVLSIRAARLYRQQCKANWQRLLDFPGTHLRASGRGALFLRPGTSGKPFKTPADGCLDITTSNGDPVAKARVVQPGVVEVAVVNSEAQICVLRDTGQRKRRSEDFVDVATGAVVLRVTDRHYRGFPLTTVHLPGERTFHFPVLGFRHYRCVLGGIDDSNHMVFRARVRPGHLSEFEVVVAAGQTIDSELVWVIQVALSSLVTFFEGVGGGG